MYSLVETTFQSQTTWTRDQLEYWIVYLKADLQLAHTIQNIKEQLKQYVTDPNIFSQTFIEELNSKSSPPEIDGQVALVKRILNILDEAEKTLRSIEELDINRDKSTLDLVETSLKLIPALADQISSVMQSVNELGPGMQELLGPAFNTIIPKIIMASNVMSSQQSPDASTIGSDVASGINLLPTTQHSKKESFNAISSLIYHLPQYFETLHSYLNWDQQKPLTPAEKIQLQIKIDKMENNLSLLSKGQIGQSAVQSATIVKKLLAISSDLINQSGPFVNDAYHKAVNELNNIRHEIVPQLISELESLEESYRLKPGVLTSQIIPYIEQYYTQTAQAINSYVGEPSKNLSDVAVLMDKKTGRIVRSIAGDKEAIRPSATVEIRKDLPVLFDNEAKYQMEFNRAKRLNVNEQLTQNNALLERAELFFKRLARISTTPDLMDLVYESEDNKKVLLDQYNTIRPHFQKLYPEVDEAIMQALENVAPTPMDSMYAAGSNLLELTGNAVSKTVDLVSAGYTGITSYFSDAPATEPSPSTLQYAAQGYNLVKATYAAGTNLLASNNVCDRAVACEQDILDSIRQEQVNAERNIQYIQARNRYSDQKEQYHAGLDEDTSRRLLEEIQSASQADMETQVVVRQSLFQHAKELNLSENLTRFINKDLHNFLIKNVSDSIISELFDNNSLKGPDQLLQSMSYMDSEEVVLYKNLVYGIYLLQKGLEQVESFQELSEAGFLITQTEASLKLLNTVIFNFINANYYLQSVAKNPLMQSIINDSLNLIRPISNMPLIADYLPNSIKNAQQPTEDEPVDLDIVNQWQKEKQVVQSVLAGETMVQYATQAESGKEKLYAPEEPPVAERDNSDTKKPTSVAKEKPEKKLLSMLLKAKQSTTSYVKQLIPARTASAPHAKDSFLGTAAEFIYRGLPEHIAGLTAETDEEKLLTRFLEEDIDKKIDLFLNVLNNLATANPQKHSKLVKMLNDFEQNTSRIAAMGKEFSLQQLEPLEQLGIALMEVADDAEYNLGLKPGALSDNVYSAFNNFYIALLMNISVDKDVGIIELLAKPTVINARLDKEIQRQSTLQQETAADEKLLAFFKQFQKLNSAQFQTLTEQEEFLMTYKLIQPYLQQINWKYDLKYFIRHLERPDQFISAWKEINNLEPDVLRLAKEKAPQNNTQRKERCAERIAYLEGKREQEELAKDDRFQTYINHRMKDFIAAKLRAELVEVIGEDYANEYIAKITDDIGAIPNIKITLNTHIQKGDDIFDYLQKEAQSITPIVIKANLTLQDAYHALLSQQIEINQELKRLNNSGKNQHPLIQEKKGFLERTQNELMVAKLPVNVDLKAVSIECALIAQKSKQYDVLIKLYDILTHMEKIVQQQQPQEDIQLAFVYTLQDMLLEKEGSVTERLEWINTFMEHPEHKNIIPENQDSLYRLLQLFKQLINQTLAKITSSMKTSSTLSESHAEMKKILQEEREHSDADVEPKLTPGP